MNWGQQRTPLSLCWNQLLLSVHSEKTLSSLLLFILSLLRERCCTRSLLTGFTQLLQKTHEKEKQRRTCPRTAHGVCFISGKCITYYICDTLTVLSPWNMVEKQDLRPVLQSGRRDKWALKHKWQLHESSICTKQSVAEDLETENTFSPSFLQISDSVDTVKWSSSNLVCISQSRKTSYILIAFP